MKNHKLKSMKAIPAALLLLVSNTTHGSPINKYLWTSLQNHTKDFMTVKFQCEKQELGITLILSDEAQTKKIKQMNKRWIVTRWEVGNTPPSQKGYRQVIYAGRVHKTGTVQIFKQTHRIAKDLQKLKTLAFKNEKQANKEYQEKADYCQKQVKNMSECPQTKKVCETQEKCYRSMPAYQPKNPSLIVSVEYPGHKWSFVFDPRGINRLKQLSCHKT